MAKRKLIPIFIPQAGCKNQCVFCNQKGITGINKLPQEEDLASLMPSGGEDYELAYYGGSFTSLPLAAMEVYLKFAAKMRDLGRVGQIRVSTHPSSVNESTIGLLKKYGVNTIELGVQSLDDEVLRQAGRNHGKSEVLYSMFLIKNNGFNLGVQLMIGLPLDTPEKVFQGIAEIIPYAPSMVRIYPLLVLADTPLAAEYHRGDYRPLSLSAAVNLTRDMFAVFSYYGIPVIRMGLQPTTDLNSNSELLVAGPFHPGFGHLVKSALKFKQAEMVLRDAPATVELVVPRNELPLLFGEKGKNMLGLRQNRRIKVSGKGLEPGSITVLTPGDSDSKRCIATLSEFDFLDRYLNENNFWSKTCI